MELSKILEAYKDHTLLTEGGKDEIYIGPPFFHVFKRDEGILIKIVKADNNEIVLSDGHFTLDYLEECGIDLIRYSEKADKILKRFGMALDGKVLRLRFRPNEDSDILRYLGYFIQGVTLIANIDL